MTQRMLHQGAEAKLIKTTWKQKPCIKKERIRKSYRIEVLDHQLRKSRTKREAKVLEKLKNNIFVPELYHQNETTLWIEYIKGKQIKEVLTKKNCSLLAKSIGRSIAIMHNQGIIHGDLTTSNMIITKDQKVYFVDFGLSYFSEKPEDKAVDLHLLRQAIEAKHWQLFPAWYEAILTAYTQQANDAPMIIQRLKKVEQRGRYKQKTKKGMQEEKQKKKIKQ